ncbi:hypothetical protein JXA63_05620 [Candidatus Woesebacteria bacterium]|nr:hypothetical protein [Candidatus Woesebacteria bacterium]
MFIKKRKLKIVSRRFFKTVKPLTIMVRTLVILVILLAAFLAIFIIPPIRTKQTLSKNKAMLTKAKLLLSEDKIAIEQYNQLSAYNLAFFEDKNNIMQGMMRITDEGFATDEVLKFKRAWLIEGKAAKYINNDLKNNLAQMKDDIDLFYKDIAPTIDKIDIINSKLSKIYEYDPRIDLSLDLQDGKEELVERAAKAANAIEDISRNVNENKYNEDEQIKFSNKAEEISASLKSFENSLKQGNINEAERSREQIFDNYPEFKKTAFALELSILQTDEAKRLLTIQDEILRKLDEMIAKLETLGDISKT